MNVLELQLASVKVWETGCPAVKGPKEPGDIVQLTVTLVESAWPLPDTPLESEA